MSGALVFGGVLGVVMTLAMVDAPQPVGSVIFCFPSLPFSLQVLLLWQVALAIALMVTEQRVHAREWGLWRRHMEHMGAWDVFTLRHIPDLRHRSA